VLVGVDDTPERRVFAVHVEDRTSETLLPIIGDYVEDGSIIHTDNWKAYNSIQELLGMSHQTVNHSITFKDKLTGVHTNRVEGTNNALKIQICPRLRVEKGIEGHLLEFVWRRQNKKDLWNALINAYREIHYD
jgi:transposase-like protein